IDGGQKDERTPVQPDRDLTQIACQASLKRSLLLPRARGDQISHRKGSHVSDGEGEGASPGTEGAVAWRGTPEGAELIIRRTVGAGVDRGAGCIGVEGKGLVDLNVNPRDGCIRVGQEALHLDLVQLEGDGIEVEEVVGSLRGDGAIALSGD